MPALMLRGLPADLLRRLRAYADRKGLGQRDAAVALIDAGLRAHERAVQAGQASAAARTPEQRRLAAAAAGKAGGRGRPRVDVGEQAPRG